MSLSTILHLVVLILSLYLACSAPHPGKYDNIKAVECARLHRPQHVLLCVSGQGELGQLFVFMVTLHAQAKDLRAPAIVLAGPGLHRPFKMSHCFHDCKNNYCGKQCQEVMDAHFSNYTDGDLETASLYSPKPYMIHVPAKLLSRAANMTDRSYFNRYITIAIRSFTKRHDGTEGLSKVPLTRLVRYGATRTLPSESGWELVQTATTRRDSIPWVLERNIKFHYRLRRQTELMGNVSTVFRSIPLTDRVYALPSFEPYHEANVNAFVVSDDQCVFLFCSEGKHGNLIRVQTCNDNKDLKSDVNIDKFNFHCHSLSIGSQDRAVSMSNAAIGEAAKLHIINFGLPHNNKSLHECVSYVGKAHLPGVHGNSKFLDENDSEIIRFVSASTYSNDFFIVAVNMSVKVVATHKIELHSSTDKDFYNSFRDVNISIA